MKRIAIVTGGNTDDRKGFLNAVIERIKHVSLYSSYAIDVFIVQEYEGWLVRQLRKTSKRDLIDETVIDGITFHNVWFKFSLIDYILLCKFHKGAFFKPRFLKRVAPKLAKYDLISFQSYSPLVKYIKEYNIPYTITWHGSDIHTHPFNSNIVFNETKDAIENASTNFFVSNGLLETSEKITKNGIKILSYNGVDNSRFKIFSERERIVSREKFHVLSDSVNIAFCGNLFEIKNVLSLPQIFSFIQEKIPKCHFFIAGDGKLKLRLKQGFENKNVSAEFLGNLSPEEMPSFLNVMNLVVLPSKNEGLPLIIVEALSCGARCVASKVGGIPEILPDKYCIEHGDNFEMRFAKACVDALNDPLPIIPSFIDWNETGRIEAFAYEKILTEVK